VWFNFSEVKGSLTGRREDKNKKKGEERKRKEKGKA